MTIRHFNSINGFSVSPTGNVVIDVDRNITANDVTVSGIITVDNSTIAVNSGTANIFNSGVSNINLGLSSNITMGNVTSTVTIQGNLIVNNSAAITNLRVNDLSSNRTPVPVTSNTVVDSFSVNKYRVAKYTMRVNSDTAYQAVEVLLVHNGINSYVTIYGSLSTSGTDIITLSTGINSGNVELLATSGFGNTTVNLLGTYVAD
jgi:hypothetical protein